VTKFPAADDFVVTGLGCVTPLGHDAATFRRRLSTGESAVRRLQPADFHGIDVAPADAGAFEGAPAVSRPGDRTGEPVLALLMSAADEALRQAGLSDKPFDRLRAGCVVGTSKGGLVSFAHLDAARRRGTLDSTRRSFWHSVPPHIGAAAIAANWGLGGPCLAPVAACATGLVSVLRGADLIRDDVCDVVVAGSGDASLHPAVLGSFRRMGVLSRRSGDRPASCRPFNVDRDGFVVGEGAAVYVLERRSHAEARGVEPIAAILGGAVLSDPSGLTSVDPTGATLARAIRDTLDRSGVSPESIGHLHLHGTATRTNDVAEAHALHAAFGPRAEDIPCVAIKGAIGHLLGAAGAVELAAAVLSVRDGRLPPTVNLTELDPACRLRLSNETHSIDGYGLKISLGFGGHVAVACVG
jgi:3-oxoacyl-[acyl-carrier-protein] synthase II